MKGAQQRRARPPQRPISSAVVTRGPLSLVKPTEGPLMLLGCPAQRATWRGTIIVKIAILDDWQDVAKSSADWSGLGARTDLTFFPDAFGTEDEAAAALADFDILLTMRERTAFPETLIRRLPKLRMISITGASNASLDVAACTRMGITVCNTAGGARALPTLRPNWRLAF